MTRDEFIALDLPEVIGTTCFLLHPPQREDGKTLDMAKRDGYEDFVKWLQFSPEPPTEKQYELECIKQQAGWITRCDIRFLCFDTSQLSSLDVLFNGFK